MEGAAEPRGFFGAVAEATHVPLKTDVFPTRDVEPRRSGSPSDLQTL